MALLKPDKLLNHFPRVRGLLHPGDNHRSRHYIESTANAVPTPKRISQSPLYHAVYAPLKSDAQEIRLLRLKPSRNIEAQPQGYLVTVSLKLNPQYEALSYVWGDPSITKPVELDGMQWKVTSNLYAALQNLRDASEELLIWVDALCINQSSTDERSSQVLLMKDIYSKAGIVRVWLGEPTPGSDNALEILREFGRGSILKDMSLNGRPLTIEDGRSLNELLKGPWWKRVWVVQEYVLAWQVTLHCGRAFVSHEGLLRFGQDPTRYRGGWDGDVTNSQGVAVRYYYQREAHYVSPGWKNFFLILGNGCFYSCTDPRDSIYGFLGLANGAIAEYIKPDYTISTVEVYCFTAIQLTHLTGSLKIFNLTRLRPRSARLLPTWVPDWDKLGPWEFEPGSIAEDISAGDTRSRWVYDQNLRDNQVDRLQWEYRPCGRRPLSFEVISNSIVRLKGACLDSISVTSIDTFTLYDAAAKDQRMVMKGWQDLYHRAVKDNTPAGTSLEGASSIFWQVLINGHWPATPTSDRRPCQPSDFEGYQAWFAGLEGQKYTEFHTAIYEASAGRRMFVTQTGLLGVGSVDMEIGDFVYILDGGHTPFILRWVPSESTPETYELVGDCYVHGIMYGEAVGPTTYFHDVFLV